MRLAIAQIVSGAEPIKNLEMMRRQATLAKAQGAEVVVFPEATMCAFGNRLDEVAEQFGKAWADAVRALATELQLVIVAGMFTPGTAGKVRNTLIVTGAGIDTHYDKIHLFDAFGFAESDSVDAGTTPVTFDVNGTTFGLATCYDVRFPNLFTANARAGAQINIVCASWGAGPGKAEQWDLLVRARAMDSTTFVVACGQADPITIGQSLVGTAPTGIGYSAVISPLGAVIRVLGPEPELAFVDIDPAEVVSARAKLPVLANARSFTHA
ncbi:MAG: carbon-nitrogen hydrolase family protein [Thermoleophilia bacterium]|nr:carbon-nitrogen hydrolase family protein [Thermoleophilia bacterium]